MGKIIHHHGDIFNSTAPAFGHGCNTVGRMGSGIAPLFKARYPKMYLGYAEACKTRSLTPGGVYIWNEPNGPTIYNIASQDLPGPHARLQWLTTGLQTALTDADHQGHNRIALPRIAAGLGGLQWATVLDTLEKIVKPYRCDIEIWSL